LRLSANVHNHCLLCPAVWGLALLTRRWERSLGLPSVPPNPPHQGGARCTAPHASSPQGSQLCDMPFFPTFHNVHVESTLWMPQQPNSSRTYHRAKKSNKKGQLSPGLCGTIRGTLSRLQKQGTRNGGFGPFLGKFTCPGGQTQGFGPFSKWCTG
jgi:hypothetical protein